MTQPTTITDNINLYDFPVELPVDCEQYGKGTAAGARILFRHPKAGDPAEWPIELRVREMPK